MAGGFGIQGLQIHKVLKGAHDRYLELQDEDWKTEKARRGQYIEQLSALIPTARNQEDVAALNNEIAAVIAAPREKPYKPKLIKTPSIQAPKPMQGQGQQGAGNATPPPFDFKQLSAALTGAPQQSGMPDVPQSAGGPPDSISAVPPEMAALLNGAGSAPPTGAQPAQMVPPVGAGSLGATGAPTPQVPGLTPPALPQQVATPPGRSVPEPSPLVGTLPGTPSPAPASPQTAAAVPPPINATPGATPGELPVNLMGYVERARLPYELNAEFGATKTGRPIGGSTGNKPLVTIRDMIAAAKADRTIVSDPDSPTGYAVIPIEEENLTSAAKLKLDLDRSKLELNQIRGESIQHRDKIAELNIELQRERIALSREKNEVAMSHWVADNSIKVGKNYEKSVQKFEEAKLNLGTVETMLAQATGPADYIAILTIIHNTDDTAAREGEVRVFRSAASLPDRLDQIWGKATEGDLLNGTVRAQMLAAIRASYAAMGTVRAQIDARYAHIADKFGLDRNAIFLPGSPYATTQVAGTGTGAPTPPPVVGATPSSPKAAAPATSTRERWVRDPKTGKLRKAS
jgi:hypothetical protein